MKFMSTGAALGAELVGADLRNPLTAEQQEQVRQALARHGVIFARNQMLSESEFVRFARSFGEIESYASTLQNFILPDHPEILVLSNIERDGKPVGVKDAGSYWHTDRSYVENPAWTSCLMAKEVPHDDSGHPLGDTEFASMTAALEALQHDIRQRVEGLHAWHEYVFRFSEKNESMPGVAHPIVLKHPLTGQPCLYVNRGFTHRVVELDEEEGAELLQLLYAHAEQKRFTYRHKWQVGDVLLWDNYATQHNATGGYGPHQRRLMWRTTVKGPKLHKQVAEGMVAA